MSEYHWIVRILRLLLPFVGIGGVAGAPLFLRPRLSDPPFLMPALFSLWCAASVVCFLWGLEGLRPPVRRLIAFIILPIQAIPFYGPVKYGLELRRTHPDIAGEFFSSFVLPDAFAQSIVVGCILMGAFVVVRRRTWGRLERLLLLPTLGLAGLHVSSWGMSLREDERLLWAAAGTLKDEVVRDDGSGRCVVEDERGTLRVRESGGRILLDLPGYAGKVRARGLSLDGRQLVTIDGGGRARIWDLESARRIKELQCTAPTSDGPREIGGTRFSIEQDSEGIHFGLFGDVVTHLAPTGDWEVHVQKEGKSSVVTLRMGPQAVLGRWELPKGWIQVRLAPRCAVFGSGSGEWIAFDLGSRKEQRLNLPGSYSSLEAVSSDGRTVCFSGRVIRLWDLESGKVNLLGPGSSVRMSPDGTRTAIRMPDGWIRVFDREGHLLKCWSAEDTDRMVFSPDGRDFIATGSSGRVLVWTRDAPETAFTIERHRGDHLNVAFGELGPIALVSSPSQGDAVWRLRDGRRLLRVAGHEEFFSLETVLSPDGERLACVGTLEARVLRVSDGALLLSVTGSFARRLHVDKPAFSPSGRMVVIGGALYDVDAKKTLHQFEGGRACWGPDDDILAVTSESAVTAYSPGSDEPLFRRDGAWCIGFSPSARHIVVSVAGVMREVWDLSTSTMVQRWRQGRHAFNQDGSLLAWEEDGTVHISHTGTWKEVRRLALSREVNALALSPDGRYLAAQMMGRVSVFSLDDGRRWSTHPIEETCAPTFSADGTYLRVKAESGAFRIYRF